MEFPDQVRAIKAMAARHPEATKVIIEKKANGAAAITELQNQVSGIQAVVPTRDKVARADAIRVSSQHHMLVRILNQVVAGKCFSNRHRLASLRWHFHNVEFTFAIDNLLQMFTNIMRVREYLSWWDVS